MSENSVVIVGDGPTGLSAALFLAKNGFEVDVLGADETPVHKAMLHNYLGDDDMPGPHFVEKAREHAEKYGARLHQARVARIEPAGGEDGAFRVATDAGTFEGRYLVLATGFVPPPAQDLGLEKGEHGLRVDMDGRTSRDRVYAGGAAARGVKSQVATSVGDGAAIAVDILSREAGKPTHDYDALKAKPERKPAA